MDCLDIKIPSKTGPLTVVAIMTKRASNDEVYPPGLAAKIKKPHQQKPMGLGLK
jgi:hypothetical protein